jgi:hypothetical protein
MKRFIFVMMMICAGGCIEQGEPDPEQAGRPSDRDAIGAPADDTAYTETIVSRRADGTYEIEERPITLAQELTENEAREAGGGGASVAESNALDPGCSGSSEWLYDQPGFVGNRICFSHPTYNCETYDLSMFTRTRISCFFAPGGLESLPWARGDWWDHGYCESLGEINTNRVRSIWTGYSADPGVWFYDDTSLGGGLRSAFTGAYVQYPDVSTPGRYIQTCGSKLN